MDKNRKGGGVHRLGYQASHDITGNGHFALLVIAMLAGIACLNYYFLLKDTTLMMFDPLDSFDMSRTYYKQLGAGDLQAFMREYHDYSLFYPPYILFQPLLFYPLLGVEEDTAAFSNILSVAVMSLSVFLIGMRLSGKRAGYIAAGLTLAAPCVLAFSRAYFPDLALASFAAAAIAFYIQSDNFKSLTYSLLAGAFSGLGMLSKWTFPLYIAPVVVFYLVIYRPRISLRSKAMRNAALSLFVFLLFISLWYPANWQSAAERAGMIGSYNDKAHFSGHPILYERLRVAGQYAAMIPAALGLISLPAALSFVYLIMWQRKRDGIFYILSGTIGMASLIPLFTNPATQRYILPFVPWWCLSAGMLLEKTWLWLQDGMGFPRKISANIIASGFAACIVAAGFINALPSQDYQSHDIYRVGLVKPVNFTNPGRSIRTDAPQFVKENGIKKTLVLHASEMMTGGIYEIYPLTEINSAFICIMSPFGIDIGEYCGIPESGLGSFICGYDGVIISDPGYLTNFFREYLASEFAERKIILDKVLQAWNDCSSSYNLAKTGRDYSKGMYTDVYYYARKSGECKCK